MNYVSMRLEIGQNMRKNFRRSAPIGYVFVIIRTKWNGLHVQLLWARNLWADTLRWGLDTSLHKEPDTFTSVEDDSPDRKLVIFLIVIFP